MNNFMLQSQLIDKILENEKITDVKKSYKQISEKYREEKINSSIVLSNEKLALSYLASRMGETSNIIYDVFDKLNFNFLGISVNCERNFYHTFSISIVITFCQFNVARTCRC